MHHLKNHNVGKFGVLMREKSPFLVQRSRLISGPNQFGISSEATAGNLIDGAGFNCTTKVVGKSNCSNKPCIDAKWMYKDAPKVDGIPVVFGRKSMQYLVHLRTSNGLNEPSGRHRIFPWSVRTLSSNSASQPSQQPQQEKRKDISTVEDPFDAPTYNIPEKPVTFTEGASYSLVILAGLGIAAKMLLNCPGGTTLMKISTRWLPLQR